MSNQGFDGEYVVAGGVCQLLQERLDPAMLAVCPAVSWFDPMAVDEADRIVAMCPDGHSLPEEPGNSIWDQTVTVKTLYQQATLGSDLQKHRDRVRAVRKILLAANFDELLNEKTADELGIYAVDPQRRFRSDDNGTYFISETSFTAKCFVPTETNP